jgi:plasmid maintenance system antidote protein VapI
MRLRLAAAFGLEAAMLMGIQSNYDLAHRRLRQAEITVNVRQARLPLA